MRKQASNHASTSRMRFSRLIFIDTLDVKRLPPTGLYKFIGIPLQEQF